MYNSTLVKGDKEGLVKPKTATVSVYDKEGVVDFCKALAKFDIEILSTGGTAELLRKNGLAVLDVSEYTEFPEVMDGRVKTLHPKIYSGILALRDEKSHIAEAQKHNVKLIGMVVCNLYPFEKTIAKKGVELEEALENIDIGGPTMLRAAAKNFQWVAVVPSPLFYKTVIDELKKSEGQISWSTRRMLAIQAFKRTSGYDSMITNYLDGSENRLPAVLNFALARKQELRYGENPHQKAAVYMTNSKKQIANSVVGAEILNGKELSYNNYLDLDAAYGLVCEFVKPSAVIVKHTNPCGAGSAALATEAFKRALSGDPVSAYGGILAFNTKIDKPLAEVVAGETFFEAIIAPGYDQNAIEVLAKKPKWGKNLRILDAKGIVKANDELEFRTISGGVLAQTKNDTLYRELNSKTRAVTDSEKLDLIFAMAIVKHAKSNAIVLANNETAVGIGTGQQSRIDAVRIAIAKAGERAKGSVLASDAFFPFADSIEEAAKAGVKAICQPGGSIRDGEVIKTAEKFGVAMVMTETRLFKH